MTESDRKARDRMKTLTLKRSFGLPGGEYQSVTIEPVSGSSEAYLTKSSVSCAACHRIGLTVLPVCGPGSLTDSFLARPRTVRMLASVSISSGSLAAQPAGLCPGCCCAGGLAAQAAERQRKTCGKGGEGR